jgi:XapX domain-containing protein
MKSILGIVIAFALGFACRYFGIPSPAPPALTGALLVLAMTIGYTATDRIMAMRARRARDSKGPSGGNAPPRDRP